MRSTKACTNNARAGDINSHKHTRTHYSTCEMCTRLRRFLLLLFLLKHFAVLYVNLIFKRRLHFHFRLSRTLKKCTQIHIHTKIPTMTSHECNGLTRLNNMCRLLSLFGKAYIKALPTRQMYKDIAKAISVI